MSSAAIMTTNVARQQFTPVPAAEHYGSVMFMPENGRTTDPTKNGQIVVTGLRTAISGSASTAPFWQGPYALVAFIDRNGNRSDAANYNPHILGTEDSTQPRSMGLHYYPHESFNTSVKGKFRLNVQGEGSVPAWIIDSASIPRNVKGPFAIYAYTDDANGYIHVLDVTTGTWYDGPAAAKPAGWAGSSANAYPYDVVIGGVGGRTFPYNYGPNYNSASMWRGSIGDILFCNASLSKADIVTMSSGANPVTVATAAGATAYVHIPMVANSDFSDAVNSSFTGISLSKQGVIWPGAQLRPQTESKYIVLDQFSTPEHFPVPRNSTKARVRIKGRFAGLTGKVMFRLVSIPSNIAARDWQDSGITVSGGQFDGHVTIPEFLGRCQLQVAMESDMSMIAVSHSDCRSGPVIEVHAQSEGAFAIFVTADPSAGTTALSPTLPPNAETVAFSRIVDPNAGVYMMQTAQDQPALFGDGAATIVNYIRARTQRSVLIRGNVVGGTSPLAMMNDADNTRKWADLVALRDFTHSLGSSGECVVTGHVIFGWEANISPLNVMPVAYKPLLTGVGADSGSYDAAGNIPTADIDHYLYDGSSSADALTVVSPSNREVTAGSGVTADESKVSDRRDYMRNYSHIYNYVVGPETTAHMMEGETAAGGLPTGGPTHPEPNKWEGAVETSISLAEAICLAAGIGQYPGPVFFESISAGSAPNKVKLRLGQPRPNPGDGLPEGSIGYAKTPQAGNYAYSLHVKKSGGNPASGFEARIDGGAWAKANVVSGVITDAAAGEIELTLAAAPATSVEIAYLRGAPGSYNTATITQEEWRSGLLYFNGIEYAAGEPNSVDDLLKLGWQVAGSGVPLTLAI